MLSTLFAPSPVGPGRRPVTDGNESIVDRALAAAESAMHAEVYLRRDAHGGFGIFFYGSSTVIRRVVELTDGEDGRADLLPGDVVTRVGGMPATDGTEVLRLFREANALVSLTVAKSSKALDHTLPVSLNSEDEKDEAWDDEILQGELSVSRVPLQALTLILEKPARGQDQSWLSNFRGATDSLRPMNVAAAKSLVQRVATQLTPSSKPSDPKNLSSPRSFPHRSGGSDTSNEQGVKMAAAYISSLATTKGHRLPLPPNSLFPATASEIAFSTASQHTNSLSAYLWRDLRHYGELSTRILEAADTRDDVFGLAAARLARASKSFVHKLEAAQRPEMAASHDTGWRLNLLILASPELSLIGMGMIPLASALLSSGSGSRLRRVERSVQEIERREKHAEQLCQMNRGLRDEAVRSLSDTDLDLAVRAAFAELTEAVVDRDEAQKHFSRILSVAEACAETLPSATIQHCTPQLHGLARGPKNKKGVTTTKAVGIVEKESSRTRGNNVVKQQTLPQVASSRPGRLVAMAHTASGVLVRSTLQRLERCRQGVSNLESNCGLDADEARACYAVAKCHWAEADIDATQRLVTEFSARETELASTAKGMAQRISTHADALANLADSARDRLLAVLQPEEVDNGSCDLTTYFELSAESIEARSDLVRRQIRDRERVIAALDSSAKELAMVQKEWESTKTRKTDYRNRVARRLSSRLARLSDCQLATSRSGMLVAAASSTIEADLKACADDLVDYAHNLARLDVELRLAHLRLVSLALRVEIDRAQRWWADNNKSTHDTLSSRGKRVFLLFEAVNGTKRELHRVRDDYLNQHTRISSSKASALEDALSELAELEVLGAKVAAVADAESEEAQIKANKRREQIRNAAIARRNAQSSPKEGRPLPNNVDDAAFQTRIEQKEQPPDPPSFSTNQDNAGCDDQHDPSNAATSHDDLQIAAFASPYGDDDTVFADRNSSSSDSGNYSGDSATYLGSF